MLCFCLGVPTWGGELPDPAGKNLLANLQVHGFITQGAILTSDNNFFGESDDNLSLDWTESAINASWSPWQRIQLSGQLLARRAGEGSEGDVRLDYGLLDLLLVSALDQRFGIRLGRFKNPLGLYNDTRDVAFTRPSILLPQSIYFERTRNLALSSDGALLYGEYNGDRDDLFAELGIGLPQVDDLETELAFLQRNVPGELEARTSYIGRLIYEHHGGKLRLALSGAGVRMRYNPADIGDPLTAGSILFRPLILSVQYNTEGWSFTSEYAFRYTDFRDLGPLFPDLEVDGESFYLQFTRRFSPNWEAMIRYDVLYTDRRDREGEDFAARTGQPAHTRFAKDLTFGIRWNITPNLMVRAEYHNIDGTAWLSRLDNPDPRLSERRWQLYALLFSYRF
jgi:hypothetical protein